MKIWLTHFILATWLPTLWAESCGDILKVDNSIAYSWGADEGKQVMYSCSSGYHLFGEKTLYCTSSGEWHAPPPICKALGPRPSEPDKEDKEGEGLVTKQITQTTSARVESQSLYAAVCEDVRRLMVSLTCGMSMVETKAMLEVEKLRLDKLQQERKQGSPPMYAVET